MASRPAWSSVSFLPLGAILQDFRVGSAPASHRSIVQSFATPEQYTQFNDPYFGETIGRVANRVSGARIISLNGGKSYSLVPNSGPNSLHGGERGFGKREFERGDVVKGVDGRESLLFRRVSAHMEEGYPGAVEVRVKYTPEIIKEQDGPEKTRLEIEFEAEMVGDPDAEDGVEETVIAMTNHSYFNLNLPSSPSIEGTRATLATNLHLEADADAIPTGRIVPYNSITPDTPFVLGETSPAVDNCFVLPTTSPSTTSIDPSAIPLDTRPRPLQLLAHFSHPHSRVHLRVLSTEPAFQFYTGDYIDVPQLGGDNPIPARPPRAGFAVEPGRFVNAVNQPDWQNMVKLRRGQTYGARIVYEAWIEGDGLGKGEQ